MGTSKGYIPPTTVHWSVAKRAVTKYIKNRDSSSMANAASRFADAMYHDIGTSVAFSNAARKILLFVNILSNNGINDALKELGRSDLINKSSEEIFSSLIQEFTNYGSTTEDYLAAEAISQALEELGITEMDQFSNVNSTDLLKEMVIEYIKLSFSFRYEEKILMKCSPSETDKIIKDMWDYISNTMHSELNLKELKTVDFLNMQISSVVTNALDAYKVLKKYYGEV
jgi:hypothetical protein